MVFQDKPVVMGIIGAGTMGRGIAQVAAMAGMKVLLYDTNPDITTVAGDYIIKMLEKSVEKGKLKPEELGKTKNLISKAREMEALKECSIVVEAVIEDLKIKQELFRKLEVIVSEDCILATNTSSLSVTEIAAVCKNPGRVAGLHFFNPVPLMKLVEVIKGILTESRAVETLGNLVISMGHTPVYAQDTPGFIVNNIGRAYGMESSAIVTEGIASVEEMDNILKETCGFPLGPFELMDLTGLDVTVPVSESIYNQFYQDPLYRPSYLLQRRFAAKLLGKKAGRGFYAYVDGKKIGSTKTGNDTVNTGHSDIGKTPHVWIHPEHAAMNIEVVNFLEIQGIEIDKNEKPSAGSLCLIMPLGTDATSPCINMGIDARKTIALDTFMGFGKHRTLMKTPVTSENTCNAFQNIFSRDNIPVTLINDSPGFVVQRIMAMIINIACKVAQERIASPKDIDRAVKLGLGYPFGPLEWGDKKGAKKILSILNSLFDYYKDPRYRPSPWLIRRAGLGVSLLTGE